MGKIQATLIDGAPFKVLLWKTTAFVLVIFVLLQYCRPLFSMTDDNLAAGYPFFSLVGKHLLKGESPRFSSFSFGGHYDLLHDAQYFAWHPFYLLTSLLAGTRLRLWIMDVNAAFLYLISAIGFLRLAYFLRKEERVKIKDEWMIFCSVSYTFTLVSIVTCASWLTFENNIGALPWLVYGILQRDLRHSIGIIALVTLHQILGGHPEPFISNSIFLTLFIAGVCWHRRSHQPFVSWIVGFGLALIIASPLLVPAFEGFAHSGRSQGGDLVDVQRNLIPLGYFPLSLFFGTFLSLIPVYFTSGPITGVYIVSLASCAVALCFPLALKTGTSWKYLEILSLVLAVFAVILISRPLFISQLMNHFPLLRSMRWPFRELVQFQFFFHVFLLLRLGGIARAKRLLATSIASAFFVVPLFLFPVMPTFDEMALDRQIIFSGEFDQYWSEVRPYFNPNDSFVVLLPALPNQADLHVPPYSLLGGYNYPMLARVVCGSGYSQTIPMDKLYLRTPRLTPWGAFKVTQRAALLRERPNLQFVTLEQLAPLKVTLSNKHGLVLDLTPYIATATQDAMASR